jgi:hypothetical protein
MSVMTDVCCLHKQIECALDQLKETGKKSTIQFVSKVYRQVYLGHLKAIENWQVKKPDLWNRLEKNLKDGIR